MTVCKCACTRRACETWVPVGFPHKLRYDSLISWIWSGCTQCTHQLNRTNSVQGLRRWRKWKLYIACLCFINFTLTYPYVLFNAMYTPGIWCAFSALNADSWTRFEHMVQSVRGSVYRQWTKETDRGRKYIFLAQTEPHKTEPQISQHRQKKQFVCSFKKCICHQSLGRTYNKHSQNWPVVSLHAFVVGF